VEVVLVDRPVSAAEGEARYKSMVLILLLQVVVAVGEVVV
jgi:hypothetical protein